jgi:large subunit ribosomal protein L4
MNRKVRVLALKSILSVKAKEEAIVVVDKFDFAKPSTHEMSKVLTNLKVKGKALIVATEATLSDNAILSAFNLPTLGFIGCDQVNTYDVMNCDTLILTQEALEAITEVLSDGKN